MIFTVSSGAQEIDNDYVKKYINQDIYLSDTDASAVVLYERGSIEITEIANRYMQVYKMRRMVKVLKDDAVDEANISDFYRSTSMTGYVSNIKGATYNLINGQIVKIPLDKSAIYNTDLGNDYHEFKFALPQVKVGSIFEYSYEVYTAAVMLLPSWYFQNEYPTLRTEYEVTIPRGYPFAYVTQATPPFKHYNSMKEADYASSEAYTVSVEHSSASNTYMLWGRRNVPAMRQEPHAGNVADYAEKIEVQIQSPDANVSMLDSAGLKKLWKAFTKELLSAKKFGKQLEYDNEFLDQTVKSLTAKQTDKLASAKSIYRYVCNNIRCNDSISINPQKDIEKVFLSKDGDAAEINLLLVAMLRKAGIHASPVILSTWGRPKAYHAYPMYNNFNHTVCVVNIDGTKYFLDASSKYNAFGRLPYYCYTGYARVIDGDGEYAVVSSKQNREKSVFAIKVTEFTRNSMVMQVTQHLGMNQSRIMRKLLDEDSVKLAGLLNSRIQMMNDGGEVSKIIIENSSDPDTNLIFRCTISKKFEKPFDVFYLNADQVRLVSTNPYKPMKRLMPVEMLLQEDENYVMSLQLPENMEIEELPKSTKVNFEDKITFRHLINYSKETNFLSITSQLKRTETFFTPAEYELLSQFYEKVLTELNHVLVLKSKS